jgi:hypothetical protein
MQYNIHTIQVYIYIQITNLNLKKKSNFKKFKKNSKKNYRLAVAEWQCATPHCHPATATL